MENTTEHKLYLHCEECERGWPSAEDADKNVNGFSTLAEDFEAENPSLETILRYNWGEAARNSFVE